jgi:hypothetical protein
VAKIEIDDALAAPEQPAVTPEPKPRRVLPSLAARIAAAAAAFLIVVRAVFWQVGVRPPRRLGPVSC